MMDPDPVGGGNRVGVGVDVGDRGCDRDRQAGAAIPAVEAARAVEAADARRYQAMLDRDVTSLGQLLGDDLTYTHSSALTDDKASYLASLARGSVRYLGFERGASRLRCLGEVVLVDGDLVIEAEIAGERKRLDNHFLSVWRLGEAGWQMVAWASTPRPTAG